VAEFDSNPTLRTRVPRAHWIALACTLLVACGVLLALGWSGAWRPTLDEKRALATRPALPRTLAQARAFPKAFDAYVHDRFPPRAQLIAGLNYLRYRLGYSGAPRVIVGRHGWLFYDNDSHLGYPPASTPLTAIDLEVWLDVFQARERWLAQRGIAYAVLIVPAKESVYPANLPDWSRRARGKADGSDQDAIRRKLHAAGIAVASERDVIDLRPAFADAIRAGQTLYTAFDTHWNGYGAYLGYKALLQRLSPRFPELQARPLQAFPIDRHSGTPRDLAFMLGIAALPNPDYAQFDSPPAPSPARVRYLGPRRDWTQARVVTTGFTGPRLLLTMDSFSNALLPFLVPHFSEIVIAHNQDGYFRQDLIARFHPDIVVLEVVESGARFAMGAAPAATGDATTQPLPRFVALPAIAAVPTATLDCNLEQASLADAAAPSPHPARTIQLAGWAAQVARQRSAAQVRIVLRSPQAAYSLQLPVRLVRPDVSAHFHRGGIALSGFAARASLSGVRPGHYALAIEQDYPDGAAVCRTAAMLDLP
jgi:hypothetical protein